MVFRVLFGPDRDQDRCPSPILPSTVHIAHPPDPGIHPIMYWPKKRICSWGQSLETNYREARNIFHLQ